MMTAVAVGLGLVGALSPLLTLLRLWQIKEWRWDRLLEHLRREGVLMQLFGGTRSLILFCWGSITLILILIGDAGVMALPLGLVLLTLLALTTIAQIALRKQQTPVWTLKAIVLTVFSLLLTMTLIGLLFPLSWHGGVLLGALVPAAGPVIAACAWMVMRPVDFLLKRRVMNRAKSVREHHPTITVIGITGSVGKTTTKELISHVLRPFDAIATPEHVNTEMGVAAWISRVLRDEPADSRKILIVEMGAYRKGEIALLCSIAQPTIGVITYIGHQHLSLFGSRDAIREAKGELFQSLPESGRAFANKDNEGSDALIRLCRCPVITVGTGNDADIVADNIEETGKGICFRSLDTVFDVPLPGTHSVTSALLAIAVAKHLGRSAADIAESLKHFMPLPGTFEIREEGGITVLNDTYNASPDGVRAAIDWAALQPHPEKILLIEGIIELGQFEEDIHLDLALRASKVFHRAFVADPHFLPYFRKGGFDERAQPVPGHPTPIAAGSLLVCLGRLRQSQINRFLKPENRNPETGNR
ncbi:MAG: UDP-N-acetylmuramoyl-tripeptide--D-alanyl-D-alanine ligase [Candidatus Peribacteraceae bacterium]|nr:UDP-N-acetylmuramoyl-tripeptide--D-alanyl-D-alanine ligase [Candidatus Peribacteraceae bacterium]